MLLARCLVFLCQILGLHVSLAKGLKSTQPLLGFSRTRPLGGGQEGFRDLIIDFSDVESAEKSIAALDAIAFWSSVRKVNVTGYPSLGNWTLLESVFATLQSIEEVHWSAWKAIPARIVRSLEWNSPSCRLHYIPRFAHKDPYDTSLDPDPDWDPYDSPQDSNYKLREVRDREHKLALKSVINSTNLYSLQANIEYGIKDEYEDLELVFDAVSSSPNLRELDLKFEVQGCLLGESPFAFDFQSHPAARFPPLEVLRLSSYRLDERSDGGYAWSWKDFERDERSEWNYESDGFPPVPTRPTADGQSNLDAWLEIMDWSHLHTLEITYPRPSTLDKLRGNVLPSLEHLVLIGGYGTDDPVLDKAVLSFVKETVKPLESLSLQNINSINWNTLIISTLLKKNTWKELKRLSLGNERNTLFLERNTISQFLNLIPKLEDLDLNVDRSDLTSLDLETYTPLVFSPTIRYLSFRFPSPDHHYLQVHNNETIAEEYRSLREVSHNFADQGDDTDPLVNSTSVQLLFEELRKRKQGKELRNLHVHVGNWDSRNSCGMWHEPRMRIAFYECRVDNIEGRGMCDGTQTRSAGYF